MIHFTSISDKFAIVRDCFDACDRGDWEGLLSCLGDEYVFEFIVFDGPNVCFTKKTFKDHFEAIPGFKLATYKILNVIEGDESIFIHATTSTPYVAYTTDVGEPPQYVHVFSVFYRATVITLEHSDCSGEIFFVVHVKDGKVVRKQVPIDSAALAKIMHASDAV